MTLARSFVKDLFFELTRNEKDLRGEIIKKHTDNFETHGEFSFPWNLNPWKYYLLELNEDIGKFSSIFDYSFKDFTLESLDDGCQRLVEKSGFWTLKILKCVVINERIHVFLNRQYTIKVYFEKYASDIHNFCLSSPACTIKISHDVDDFRDLSSHRLLVLSSTCKKLLGIHGHNVLDPDSNEECDVCLLFTLKHGKCKLQKTKKVYCGPVLNMTTGLKENIFTSGEYLSKRTMDMQLIAQHKYGLRVKNEEQWKVFLEQIGEAAVTYDLLQIKPSHPVTISTTDNGSGCSKGAAFVLYNGARLSSIINTYKKKSENGLYPPFSSVHETDFGLLNDEDEWILLFNYVMAYSDVLKKCIHLDSEDTIVAPHHLCTFLSAMTGRFSVYYRRVRVLLEPRKHLIPVVQARLHLLLAIQAVLNDGLAILNIAPVTQM